MRNTILGLKERIKRLNRKNLIIIFGLLLITALIPLTVLVARQRQNTQGKAQEIVPEAPQGVTVISETESFETGFGGWQKDAWMPQGLAWSINRILPLKRIPAQLSPVNTTSPPRAKDGDWEVGAYQNGTGDDGTVWLTKAFQLNPNASYEVNVSFYLWSKSQSSANTWSVVGYAGSTAPKIKSSQEQFNVFKVIGETDQVAGWKQYTYKKQVKTDSNPLIWVAFGQHVAYETERTYYWDLVKVEIKSLPSLQVKLKASPTEGPAGTAVTFRAETPGETSEGAPVKYEWFSRDSGDPHITTIPEYIHYYNNAGTFTPVVRVTFKSGKFIRSNSVNINIFPESSQGSINGTVRKLPDNALLPGVTVALVGTTKTTITSSTGGWAMSNIPSGSRQFTFSKAGFVSKTATVTIPEGQSISLHVQLTPAATTPILSPAPKITLSTNFPSYYLKEKVTLKAQNGSFSQVQIPNGTPWFVEKWNGRDWVRFFMSANLPAAIIPPGGTKEWVWDQKDNSGQFAPSGKYRFNLSLENLSVKAEFDIVQKLGSSGFFTFNIVGQTLRVYMTNPQSIRDAIDNFYGINHQYIPSGLVVDDRPGKSLYDPKWSWHLKPDDITMIENAIEVCDGVPSDIERDLDNWMRTVGRYCPWSARINKLN